MLNKNSKRIFKEKIVHMYISVIKGEQSSNENFWNEFFLLKANGISLEQELQKIENIDELKKIVNILLEKSLYAIQDSNHLRIINGLITLCSISHHVLFTVKTILKENGGTTNDIFEILFNNKDTSEQMLTNFIESICNILFNDIHYRIKTIALKLLLIFSTAYTDVNSNKFMDNFMSFHRMFDALIDLLNTQDQQDELRILFLLTIFLNYKKPNTNPYVMKLSIVDNEIILNRYSTAITNQLIKFNIKFDQLSLENKSGLFSSISSMVGTIFSNEDNNITVNGFTSKKFPFQTVNLVLLAFFEAVSLNRNFISLLTTTCSPELLSQDSDPSDHDSTLSNKFYGLAPPNLLVAFLEFSSIVMFRMKDALQTTRLCFIILTCITEDACANSIIHDNNMSFFVNLKRTPMRHRKLSTEKTKVVRPICHTIIDLMIEFILSHLNRHTNHESFNFCLGIIHRLLCYEKRCKVRIHFDWKELWSCLILLIKFLLNNESYLLKHQFDIFTVSQQIVTVFNMFILYGDNFLFSGLCYDELYYEIIRMHNVFDNLNSFALRHITKEDNGGNNQHSSHKDVANKLTNSLINIKAIIAHLNAKLEMYSSQNKIVTLSEEQVLDVIRNNCDTLTLKLSENLDSFEPYNFAKTNEIQFFTSILSMIIEDFIKTKSFAVNFDEQHNLIQEIQLMSPVNMIGSSSNAPTLTPTSTYFESVTN